MNHLRCLSLYILLMAMPALAHADNASDIVRIFGRDPGTGAAHACFVRHYTKAHLKTHPDQMAGSCSVDTEGKTTLGCGIDCDGGHLGVRVKNETSLLVEIPESVRLFDPSENDDAPDAELPKGARFGADDKLFRLDRTALKDCTAVIYDDEVKAKVLKGVLSQ